MQNKFVLYEEEGNKIYEKLDVGLLPQDMVCISQRQDVAIIYLE